MRRTNNLRKSKILELLTQRGKLNTSEAAEFFSISLPTVRRLFSSLANDGKVLRTHGGIRRIPEIKDIYSFDVKLQEFNEEKERIAKYASSFVKNGQIVFLESGTTVRQCAIALAERVKKGELNDFMVFTNSLTNLEILHPFCKVTLLGGLYRHERQDFSGYLCDKTLQSLRFDLSFIGADAINMVDGIMALDIDTVRFDEILVSRSEKVIILADSAKFEKYSLISYATISEVTKIITDSNLQENILNEYKKITDNLIYI